MINYPNDISSIETTNTDVDSVKQNETTMIIDISIDAPDNTCISESVSEINTNQIEIYYSAPQKLIVRKYRLRK